MSEHTKEPLGYGEDNDGWYISRGDVQIAHGLTEEDARRIVACVNACAGISTTGLEVAGLGGLHHIAEATFEQRMDRNGLVEQRDNLLAALKMAHGHIDADDGTSDYVLKLIREVEAGK